MTEMSDARAQTDALVSQLSVLIERFRFRSAGDSAISASTNELARRDQAG